MAGKEALVIVLDIGQSMGEISHSHNGTEMTGLDQAKKAFRLIVQQKLLFGYKQDVCSVLLFNSKTTKNACNDEHGGYEFIEEYFELQTPNLDLLECIDNVQCNVNGKEADAMDALLAGAQIIINYVGTKKFKKRIFLITDAATPINDIEQIKAISDSFKNENIQFYCIGVGFGTEAENDTDANSDGGDMEIDIKSFEDIKLVHNNDEYKQRSDVQIRNEKILRYFSHLIEGNVFAAGAAIKMMSDLRGKSVLFRPSYTGSLKITSKLIIQTKIYCRSRQCTLPSLKKESTTGNETNKVMMDRLYKNKFRTDDDDEEVAESERIKSYLYGKERIPFNEEDEFRLNYKSGDKHFECLGVVSSAHVKRYQFMGVTHIVLANPDSPSSQYALSAFIRACHEKKLCILARFVARKNASPKFVILQPRIKSSKEVFILNELPFFEDVRKFPFASFDIKKEYKPTDKQVQSAKDLIKSLNLMNALIDDDGDHIEALRPQQTFNPILQRFYQNLQHRALDPQSPLQELDPFIVKTLEPDSTLFNNENTKKCVADFEKLFPTKLIPKKLVKKERMHWNDINDELDNLFGGMSTNVSNNNNKKEEDGHGMRNDDNMMSEDDENEIDLDSVIQSNEITKIGTVQPCKDFDLLLSKKNVPDLFERLSNEMWKLIHSLIGGSYQGLHFDKAIECMEHLRIQSIKEEEPLLFNTEMRRFKAKYKEKIKKIWTMIVDKKVSLICMDEFDDEDVPDGLKVTKEEKMEFLVEKEENDKEKVKVEQDSDDDDFELV